MGVLQAETACDNTIAKLDAVKAAYVKYFEDPDPLPPGYVSEIDPACVAAYDSIKTIVLAIKDSGITAAIIAVTGGDGAGESLILASTAQSLESAAEGCQACFERWCDGVIALSNGEFLTRIINNLQVALASTLSLAGLRTLLQQQPLLLITIQAACNSVKGVITSYPPEVKRIMIQIGVQSVALSNPIYKTKLAALNPIHLVTNAKVSQAYEAIPVDDVERTNAELRALALSNLMANTGFKEHLASYISILKTNVNILNGEQTLR